MIHINYLKAYETLPAEDNSILPDETRPISLQISDWFQDKSGEFGDSYYAVVCLNSKIILLLTVCFTEGGVRCRIDDGDNGLIWMKRKWYGSEELKGKDRGVSYMKKSIEDKVKSIFSI